MKQFAKLMLVVLGLAVVAAALSSIPSRPATAATTVDETVKVVNTPLPVQGSVAVNNFPATQPVSGTVSVGNFPSTLTGGTVPVSGTVTANVTFPSSVAVTNVLNSSSQPVPLLTRADKDLVDEPFATSLCAGGSGLSSCNAISTLGAFPFVPPGSFTVPSTDSAGNSVKGLVIQFISGICGTPEVALTTAAGPNALNGVTEAVTFLDVSDNYIRETTSIVAAPGTTVALFGTSSSGACWLTVNGYLAH